MTSQASILSFFAKRENCAGSSNNTAKAAPAAVIAADDDRRATSDGEEDDDEEESGDSGSSSSSSEEGDGEDETAPAAASAAQGSAPFLSPFELQRLANIERNKAFLATLGIDKCKPQPLKPKAPTGAGKRRKGARGVGAGAGGSAPTRRSTRLQGGGGKVVYDENALHVVEEGECAAIQQVQQLKEIEYDDSDVFKYSLDSSTDEAGVASGADGDAYIGNGREVKGVQLAHPHRTLQASGLTAIYSMHFSGGTDSNAPCGSTPQLGLLAAGGKGGIVALFRVAPAVSLAGDADQQDASLMTFRAHKGWVSAVQFAERGGATVEVGGGRDVEAGGRGGRALLLLSSGNDGVVKLWDVSRQSKGTPLLVAQACDLHSKGIFSMHMHRGVIATASKDRTVAISKLVGDGRGIALDRVLGDTETLHAGVIKDVQLRDATTVASCGDDASVRVCDIRAARGYYIAVGLEDVHSACAHTVRWHPTDEHLLLTAGLDTVVKLFDLRKPNAAAVEYRGHVPFALPRYKAIHRPEFYDGGAAVITCGERSDALSMYDTKTGTAISKGVVGSEMSTLSVHQGNSTMVAAAQNGGEVVLLKPVWA
ncbi:WD40-repeat-containing domain protein [Tribonema minus]|uniref:WD40-repeat-containing domain protein n=1 Tax=Tribonema minus TaxID=303371 RepID=A0A835ZGB7_9STRA|nr:WD40-repeat-containing domain protein [Tribonema minus]